MKKLLISSLALSLVAASCSKDDAAAPAAPATPEKMVTVTKSGKVAFDFEVAQQGYAVPGTRIVASPTSSDNYWEPVDYVTAVVIGDVNNKHYDLSVETTSGEEDINTRLIGEVEVEATIEEPESTPQDIVSFLMFYPTGKLGQDDVVDVINDGGMQKYEVNYPLATTYELDGTLSDAQEIESNSGHVYGETLPFLCPGIENLRVTPDGQGSLTELSRSLKFYPFNVLNAVNITLSPEIFQNNPFLMDTKCSKIVSTVEAVGTNHGPFYNALIFSAKALSDSEDQNSLNADALMADPNTVVENGVMSVTSTIQYVDKNGDNMAASFADRTSGASTTGNINLTVPIYTSPVLDTDATHWKFTVRFCDENGFVFATLTKSVRITTENKFASWQVGSVNEVSFSAYELNDNLTFEFNNPAAPPVFQ